MKTGTKSLLFGVHQFIWHPLTVWLAWIHLFHEIPSIKETICIIIHDWGYFGKPNMDGAEGERHPEFAAKIAGKLLGETYRELCLYHSRHYARNANASPSKLCWADKYSIMYEPFILYVPRAWLTGELHEYRTIAQQKVPLTSSHRAWFKWVKAYLSNIGLAKAKGVQDYINPTHDYKV